MEVWKPTTIGVDKCLQSQIGPLQIRLRRSGDEIHIATERLADPDSLTEISAPVPVSEIEGEEMDWRRWVVGSDVSTVQLTPRMPARPVVVRPELPVSIPTGQEALFFVSIPICVGISASKSGKLQLCEVPTLVLSNTWFGDPMSGELCYALRSRARRQIADSEPRPNRAVCPVKIRNTAPAQLSVERFCVHVEHLRIYSGSRQLWTNEVNITFKGESEVSQVTYGQSPPSFEPVGQLLSEARTPLKKALLKRSLGGLSLFGGA
ncbi:MAG: DUF432 domain-containing protein [Phycisphaerales bacterium]|nr:MAG: DUF432 domain-containing protein [Phycisphaerales bacterium]